jgi:membrane protease YdiL (CAAX protease family)
MFSKLLGALFVFILLVGVPILSHLTAREARLRFVPRPTLYFSAVVSQWLVAALGIAVALLTLVSFIEMGFKKIPLTVFVWWSGSVAAAALLVTGLLLLMTRCGWWPDESPLVYLLLPRTRGEKLWAVLVLAPTAAACEEFLYRGYLIFELTRWFGSVSWAWAISSAAFGLAHAYQGLSGMLRVAALGALLAYPVVKLGSLYPAMAAHFAIDALALAWLGPKFLGQAPKS